MSDNNYIVMGIEQLFAKSFRSTINKKGKPFMDRLIIELDAQDKTLIESIKDFPILEKALVDLFGLKVADEIIRKQLSEICSLVDVQSNDNKEDIIKIIDPDIIVKVNDVLLYNSITRNIIDSVLDESLSKYDIIKKVKRHESMVLHEIDQLINDGFLTVISTTESGLHHLEYCSTIRKAVTKIKGKQNETMIYVTQPIKQSPMLHSLLNK